jgi:hypothetical protein
MGSGPFCCHIEDFKRYSALLLADIGCGLVGGVNNQHMPFSSSSTGCTLLQKAAAILDYNTKADA